LSAYEQACEHGEGGAYLRREGLYSSLISEWRKQRDAGVTLAVSFCAGLQIRRFAVMSGLSPILSSRRQPLLLASSHVHRRLSARTWPLRHPAQLSRGAVDDPAGIGAHTHLLEAGQPKRPNSGSRPYAT
jgi:hypothetical protein